MMLKRLLLLVLTLTLAISTYAITDYYGDLNVNYGYVHITSVKYEPYPAEPGKYFDLWLKVQNAGTEKGNLKFKLIPKYPFSLDASDTAERNIDSLLAGETTLLHYKIRTDSKAIEGKTPLYYEATIFGMTESSNINIWVQTIDANIAVNAIKTARIAPGETKPVEIELENLGDSPLSNINVKLDLTSATLPFIPINSTTEKKLFVIEGKQKGSVIFNIMALPGAVSNSYKIPIEIKYNDGTGTNYTKSSIIGLVVGANPDLSLTIASSTIYSKGSIGVVGVKITNKGLSDVKLMNVKIKNSENYQVLGESTVYVGNVDSDDYETAEYRIKVNKVKNGITPLTLELDYLDANNNKYVETKEVELKIISAKDLGISDNGGAVKIIAVLIIIVTGFFLYRGWEKKRLAKK